MTNNNNDDEDATIYVPTMEGHWAHMTLSMGRLEGKIDQLLTSQVIQKETTDDHENRLRVLEKGMWKRVGFVGAGSGLGGAVIGVLIKTGVIPA